MGRNNKETITVLESDLATGPVQTITNSISKGIGVIVCTKFYYPVLQDEITQEAKGVSFACDALIRRVLPTKYHQTVTMVLRLWSARDFKTRGDNK